MRARKEKVRQKTQERMMRLEREQREGTEKKRGKREAAKKAREKKKRKHPMEDGEKTKWGLTFKEAYLTKLARREGGIAGADRQTRSMRGPLFPSLRMETRPPNMADAVWVPADSPHQRYLRGLPPGPQPSKEVVHPPVRHRQEELTGGSEVRRQ